MNLTEQEGFPTEAWFQYLSKRKIEEERFNLRAQVRAIRAKIYFALNKEQFDCLYEFEAEKKQIDMRIKELNQQLKDINELQKNTKIMSYLVSPFDGSVIKCDNNFDVQMSVDEMQLVVDNYFKQEL